MCFVHVRHCLTCDMQFEYEDILPYADFTVRVPQQFIYLLPEILEQLVADQPEKVCQNRPKST